MATSIPSFVPTHASPLEKPHFWQDIYLLSITIHHHFKVLELLSYRHFSCHF